MNKNKLVKGLAIGLLAGVGALTFVGCANVNVTQDQADSAFEVMEDARDFMDEVREDLNILTSKLTKEDAIAILKKAKYTGVMNLDNRYANFTYNVNIIKNGKNVDGQTMYSGQLSNGKQFTYSKSATHNAIKVEEGNGFISYAKNDGDVSWTKTTTEKKNLLAYTADGKMSEFLHEYIYEIENGNLTCVSINEKGNYVIEYGRENNDDSSPQFYVYGSIEIDGDYRVVSLTSYEYDCDLNSSSDSAEEDKIYYTMDSEFHKIDYSKVTDTVVAEVEAKIAEIEASTAQI